MKVNVLQVAAKTMLEEKMKTYSKYVLQERALPDARDGLKPVQRRLLYAMYQLKLGANQAKVKCARIVGETMGRYHPHGDKAIYDALVGLNQEWKNNLPLIEFQGNNGSVDGLDPAAMRYTEARLSPVGQNLFMFLEKATVAWQPTFDESTQEPVVLPTLLPMTLINGISGIAVGIATEIPPFNILELLQALQLLLQKPDATETDLQTIVKAPDWPLGGILKTERSAMLDYYRRGQAKMILQADYQYEPTKQTITFTSIPYGLTKAAIMKQLEDLVIESKLPLIKSVFDFSTKQAIKIEVRLHQAAQIDQVHELVENLWKTTKLGTTISCQNWVIVNDGQQAKPQILGLKGLLKVTIEHALTILQKAAEFDLQKAQERQVIVTGWIKAIGIMDQLLALLRSAQNKAEVQAIMKERWDFVEAQIEAILAMPLYRLIQSDLIVWQTEAEQLKVQIQEYKTLINDEQARKRAYRTILQQYAKTFAHCQRKTKVVWLDQEQQKRSEPIKPIKTGSETSPATGCHLTITKGGNLFYHSQPSTKLKLAKGDQTLFTWNDWQPQEQIVAISNYGTIYPLSGQDLVCDGASQNIFNRPAKGERLIFAITKKYQASLILVVGTKKGFVKATYLNLLQKCQKPTALMILQPNDQIVDGFLIPEQETSQSEIFSISQQKMVLSYWADAVRPTGLKTQGICSHKIKSDDQIAFFCLNQGQNQNQIIFGKRIKIKGLQRQQFPTAKRAQSGKRFVC